MGQKSLRADIILGAKTDGFSGAMNEINKLGQALSSISNAAADMLKQSAEVYQGYEDNMLTVRAVLNSSKTSATELNRNMQSLDQAAQNWAASTIFNTTDVSAALVEASRAGWSYDQMMSGIPNVMNMAQAAGMDLASAMKYFIPIMSATGTSFDDGSLFIDKWVTAANSAPTTVSEIGDAIKDMGAVSQMFSSDNEMFTLVDLLAKNGVTGSQAGTALRNMVARLYAPTDKAAEAMEALGVSMEEVIDDGEEMTAAEDALNAVGLSAYDADGNMRPMLDLFKDMSKQLSGKTEKEVNSFLKSVFGTRQYANAYTMLKAVQGGYEDLFNSIENASGSAESAGQIMTSGLTGALTKLESKWEAFQLSVGEKFAPAIELVADGLSGLMDIFNNMDDTQVAALTGSLEAVAALAPAMLAGTGAVKLVETLGVQGTAILVTAAAVGAIAAAMAQMNEEYEKGLFGDVALDTSTLNKYLDNQNTIYSAFAEMMKEGEQAVTESATNFSDNTATLNEKMFSYVIGGAKLTAGQISELQTLGSDIVSNVQSGIQGAKISSTQFFSSIFGDDSSAVSLVGNYYDYLSSEASTIGEQLRSQIVSALADGSLNGEEQQAIQATVARLAAIEAEIQNQMDQAAYYELIHRAQNVSLESADAFLNDLNTQQTTELASVDDLYNRQYGILRAAYESALENGSQFYYNGQMISASDISWDEMEAQFNQSWEDAKTSTKEKYSDAALATLKALFKASGANVAESSANIYGEMLYGNNPYSIIFDYVNQLVNANGGREASEALVASMRSQGRNSSASALRDMLNFYDNYMAAKGWYMATGGDTRLQEYVMNELNEEDARAKIPALSAGQGTENAQEYMEAAQTVMSKGLSVEVNWHGYTGGGGGSGNERLPMTRYAEGGRANEASIFGEAGAEWAIPEEHSQRTASLLNAARAASGFTWDDLAKRNGGLNDGAGRDITLNYSPTVNANDATDVENVLLRDKKNLRRVMEDLLESFGMSNMSGAYV